MSRKSWNYKVYLVIFKKTFMPDNFQEKTNRLIKILIKFNTIINKLILIDKFI